MRRNIILILVLLVVLAACYYVYKRYMWHRTDTTVTSPENAMTLINNS